jgi:hypothetical protein
MRIRIRGIVVHRILRALAIGTIAGLAGCAALGPKEIHYGRTNYNSAVQTTTNDQMFMNIIRAKNAEPTLFVDVTEVISAASFQAQISGGATGIGAHQGSSGGTLAGTVGNISTSLQYQDQPTIHYAPLGGQPLIQQLVRPVDVDSIWFLSDSDWPLSSILTFTVNYLSPNFEDHFSALNAILQLDAWGALAIAAVKSDLIQPPSQNDDALVLYLEPNHVRANKSAELGKRRKDVLDLWIRLLRLYEGTPQGSWGKTPAAPSCETSETLAKNLYALQKRVASMELAEVNHFFQCLPNWMELRTAPIKSTAETEGKLLAPVMRTRSALGILKTSVEEEEGSQIEFLPFKTYEKIRDRQPKESDFYILLQGERKGERKNDRDLHNPEESGADRCAEWSEVAKAIQMLSANSRDNEPALRNAENLCRDGAVLDKCGHVFMDMCVTLKIQNDLLSGVIPYSYYGVDSPMDVDNFTHVKMENRLAHLRRFILIIEDDSPPERNGINSFVSYQAIDDRTGRNTWYYIDNNDRISKNNFTLLLEFFTIMAIPSQTPALQSSYSVTH